MTLKEATQNLQRSLVTDALSVYRGNVTRAANHLGVSRVFIHAKLKELKIDIKKLRKQGEAKP